MNIVISKNRLIEMNDNQYVHKNIVHVESSIISEPNSKY